MQLTAADAARATGGSLTGADVALDGATHDSRAVEPGNLFVAIVAERDGHDFIADALARGAPAFLASRGVDHDGTAITVDDTVAALQRLATWARSSLDATVVGITGSVGKTTVKDLLRAVLDERLRTAASERSFNNEIGVPLTVLRAPDDVQALVIEMGARGRDHIASLCDIARPEIGVVTRVAAVHTELFGSLDDVAEAKGELVESLPADGCAVLNAEDERVAAMATRARSRVLRYGAQGDVVAEHVSVDDDLRASFRLASPWGHADVRLGVRGAHQVSNALAAAAAALAAGVDLDAVRAGLARAELSPWRMELVRLPSGAVVLNDAYNANPTSVRAALDALHALPARRRAAVLGVMAELGPTAPDEHLAVGDHARALGIRVIAVGTVDYGGDVVAGIDEAVAALGRLGAGDAVLVKGSRVAQLERVVERLR